MTRLRGIGRALVGLALTAIFAARAEADGWYRGAVVLDEAQGEATLRRVGGETVRLSDADLPYYLPGLLQMESSQPATLRLNTSNGVPLFWSGPGYFAFERFDQFLTGGKPAAEISRMRLNLREGLLIVDSRPMAAGSQLIVETPLGRIQAVEALWLLSIDYDMGSRMYQFTIACLAGSIRFIDRRDEVYPLRQGQRLAGVGSANHPAIEVSEIDQAARELIDEAGFSVDSTGEPAELRPFLSHMEALPRREARLSEMPGAVPATEGAGERRFIIEYAPPAPERTPFRGKVRPPSQFESDLF